MGLGSFLRKVLGFDRGPSGAEKAIARQRREIENARQKRAADEAFRQRKKQAANIRSRTSRRGAQGLSVLFGRTGLIGVSRTKLSGQTP